jgi:hypothetical protein
MRQSARENDGRGPDNAIGAMSALETGWMVTPEDYRPEARRQKTFV